MKDDTAAVTNRRDRRRRRKKVPPSGRLQYPHCLMDYDEFESRVRQPAWAAALVERGAELATGVHLTQSECQALLMLLPDEGRVGRPPTEEAEYKARQIAAYSMLCEAGGDQTEAAVAATRQLYGVKRSTVFAARRRWGPEIRKDGIDEGWRENPECRRRVRRRYELFAQLLFQDEATVTLRELALEEYPRLLARYREALKK